MMQPATSIALLIPCYNAASYLPRLMTTVRAQSQAFTEILCYDDGSTDDTVAVARNLGLEIITGAPNTGVAHARNRLAAATTAEWIHFHDADDLIGQLFLERLGAACNERHDVVSCDADWVDEDTRALLIAWRYDSGALISNPMSHLLQRPMSFNCSIIRRSSWNMIGGCDESLKMWEDADVHIRLARAGARFCHVAEVHTYALRHSNSFSHDYPRSWSCRVAALERYAAVPQPSDIASVLASEAEKAAGTLAYYNDRTGAERAIALCVKLGLHPPTSRHPLLRALKTILPAYTLLRWQYIKRIHSAG